MYGSERVHEAIRAIYGAATAPDLWPEALQSVADCTGDVGAVLLWRRDDGSFGTIVSPSLEVSHADYLAHWSTRDLRAIRGVDRGYHVSRDAVTDRDVVSDDEIATDPFYRDYLIPHGLGWFAATSVGPDPRVVVIVSVQRRFDRPRFDDAELRFVAEIGRHVEQAMRLGIRLFDGRLQREGLAGALSAMNVGVFGLDSLGRVTTTNPAAEGFLGDGLMVANGRLRPLWHDGAKTFTDLLEHSLAGEAPPEPRPVLLSDGGGGVRLVIHVVPVAVLQDAIEPMLAETRAFVFVSRLEPGRPVDPTVLRDLLGLTLAEARVASLVGSGLSPRDAGAALGVVEETVRTVLKRVFAKTGVSRQAELVALLARVAF